MSIKLAIPTKDISRRFSNSGAESNTLLGPQSVMSSKRGNSSRRASRKSNRQHSRDIPKVSDYVKFGRSTFKMSNKTNKKVNFQSMFLD
mmetsp:Transcript_10048/g.15318  ORF Transcript_10048/g.15318 Transcript_10048/m.15318 type:complete len:89 (+) Transcript_10048:6068-6334(+)